MYVIGEKAGQKAYPQSAGPPPIPDVAMDEHGATGRASPSHGYKPAWDPKQCWNNKTTTWIRWKDGGSGSVCGREVGAWSRRRNSATAAA
ncbi:hypothetical protein OG21DRAFT_1509871 [Imleria badia]|nr:hypothetical protein OG21DRAFT_1509871 [Imleria badia]